MNPNVVAFSSDLKAAADEQNLIDAAQSGEVEAFARLYRRYRSALFGVCLARLKDPGLAEDVVQETFLRAFVSLPGFESGKFWSWLATIAVRQCIDIQRYRGRSYIVENPEERTTQRWSADITLDAVIATEDRIDLQRALAALAPRQRRALMLYAFEGWSYSAIASAEKISIGAVNSLLVRARRAIRAACDTGPLSVFVPVFHKTRWRFRTFFDRLTSVTAQPLGEGLMMGVQGLAVATFALTMIFTEAPATAGNSAQTPSNERAITEVQLKNETVARMATARSPSTQPEHRIDRPALVDELLDPRAEATPESTMFWSTAVSPDYENDHTIFAAGFSGWCGLASVGCHVIFVSTDGGGTWERRPAGALQSDYILLSPSYPVDPRIYMFGTAGLQESADGARSFQTMSPLGMTAAISPSFAKGDSRILIDTGTNAGTILEYWADEKLVKLSQLTRSRFLALSRPLNTYFTSITLSPGYPAHPLVFFMGQGASQATGGDWFLQTTYQSFLHRCEGLMCTEIQVPVRGDPQMRISPNFAEDGIAYVFTSTGVVAYDDSSRTFRSLQRPEGGDLWDLAVSWHSPDPVPTIFSATSNGRSPGGLHRSLDGGASWTKLPLHLPGFQDGVSRVVVTPTGRLLVSSYVRGIACSEDNGKTWAPRCPPES